MSPIYWHCSWSTAQGELVDRIEHHVASSGDAVVAARVELTGAEKYQEKARKVICKDVVIIHFQYCMT
jgi:hypothetical protein